MAVSKIKVNTISLKRDTESISQSLKNIKNKMTAMESDVTQLNGMWEGDANKAFNKAFQDDIKALELICEGIQSIINYESNAKKEYDSCEKKVSSLIDSISV